MRIMLLAMVLVLVTGAAPPDAPCVSAKVALMGLMSLGDGYFKKLATDLETLAATDLARTGKWEQIRAPLEEFGHRNVEALDWFALPDGSYWSVQNGQEMGNLADRSYFSKVLAGETVLGELTANPKTDWTFAVVAVPVRGEGGRIVGVLGASVDLEQLSERLGRELGVEPGMVFYAFDSRPRVGLEGDPALALTDPAQLGKDGSQAFKRMTRRTEGLESFVFGGKRMTLVFRKSEVTGWWYAFGVVNG